MSSQKRIKSTTEYPHTKTVNVSDDYHGTVVNDPYRWLEDDASTETSDWVDRQIEFTNNYLSQIPYLDKIEKRADELSVYEVFGVPIKIKDKYYYFYNDGTTSQDKLYVSDNLDDEGRLFLDPNTLSDDGRVSLISLDFNESGTYCAFQISENGSDWRKVFVIDLKTGKRLDDELNWVKFSNTSWQGDGFYYSRFPEPGKENMLKGKNENHAVYYHKLGDDQSNDTLIFSDPENPKSTVNTITSKDERFLFIRQSVTTSGAKLHYIDQQEGEHIKTFFSKFEYDFSEIITKGDDIYSVTNYGAPNNRFVKININNLEEENWTEIIPESNDKILGVTLIDNKFFVNFMKNAQSLVKIYDTEGNFIQNLELPKIGTCSYISGNEDDTTAFYQMQSLTAPATVYKLDTRTLQSEVHQKPELAFDDSLYETKQVWYKSKDGTSVPMFLTMKKGIKLDGNNPTLLYGYGGFDVSITPFFSSSRLLLMEQGAIFAIANIRGGGEFGKEWHLAGTKEKKQNVFDDFIAAAEYLIDNKYTSKSKLAIEGRSNGGLLIGAVMTQRPDLFQVAFPGVGVLDMLRYQKFTIGWAWAGDYGLSDTPEGFEYLYKYSPLHNVKDIKYPATMITTADHDDRVVPAHSFKFGATLQAHQQGEAPILLRIEKSAGHGSNKPKSARLREVAETIGFMFYNMGITYKS